MILDSQPAKKEWSRDKSKTSDFRQINDVIHERIHIFHPLSLIIDTSEFQRLRHVRQLSLCPMVFPSADYSRFTHSLGVYSLAEGFVRELADSQPELNVTLRDQLCVSIAALLHDLGHGILSHFYEVFLNQHTPNHTFRHEDYSKIIFRRMLERNPQLREVLDEYLDASDLVFIEELIDPPFPFVVNGQWQLKGRPVEKSFLYEIVSNKHNGLDVDKFDYFLRDSLLCNVPIAFSKTTVGRLRDTMKVMNDDTLGYRRLMFAEKHITEIRDAFEARVMLHDRVYQHKTVVAIEMMMVGMLRLADQHVKIIGGDGQLFTLSTAYNDVDAFLRVDDRHIYLIKNSTSAELAPAREKLNQIELRQLPKFICTIHLDNFENREVTAKEVEHGIRESRPEMAGTELMVHINCVHRGLGVQQRPIDRIRVYSERNNACQPTSVSKAWFKYNTFPTGGKAMARIYAPFGVDDAQCAQLQQAAVLFERRCSCETENEDSREIDSLTPKRMRMMMSNKN